MVESQRISCPQFIESMREQFEHTMAKVVDAVNGASDGVWIDQSEGSVRDALAEFREAAYRQALQMRLDETQSSFSPSEGSDQRATSPKQGCR